MDGATRRAAGRQCGYLFLGAGGITLLNSGNVLTPEGNSPLLVVIALASFALATLTVIMPWDSWSARMPGALAPFALAAVALGNRLGGEAPYTYAVYFVLVFVWIGIAQPRWTSLLVAPLATAAYVLPYVNNPSVPPAAMASAVAVIPLCVLVGETIAGAMANLRRARATDAHRAATLEALIAAGTTVHEAADHRQIGDTIARLAVDVLGATGSAIVLTDADGDVLSTFTCGMNADEAGQRALQLSKRPAAGPEPAHSVVVALPGAMRSIGALVVAFPGDRPDGDFAAQAAALFAVQAARAIENMRVIEALTDAAVRDGLTGLGNRRHAATLLASLRPGDAVLAIDLDHFKAVNDTYGHAAGDRALVEVAHFLRATVRDDDDIARLGGEEFVVILRQPGDALAAADRLVRMWRETSPPTTFSAGVETHAATRPSTETMGRADAALYEAKRTGRDRAVAASELTAATLVTSTDAVDVSG